MQNLHQIILAILFALFLFLGFFFKWKSEINADGFLIKSKNSFENYIKDNYYDKRSLLKKEIPKNASFFQLDKVFTAFDFPIQIYQNDTLIYWNNNYFPELSSLKNEGFAFQDLANVSAVSQLIFYQNYKIIVLIPLQNKSKNPLLNQVFNFSFEGSEHLEINKGSDPSQSIFSPDKKPLFEISLIDNLQKIHLKSNNKWASFFFLIAAFLLVLLVIRSRTTKSVLQFPVINFLAIFVLLILLRLFFLNFKKETGLEDAALFDARFFASAAWNLPSLGDLLLHLLVFILLIAFVLKFRKAYALIYHKWTNRFNKKVLFLANVFFYNLLLFASLKIIEILVKDSAHIPLSFLAFYDLNLNSFFMLLLLLIFIFINVGILYGLFNLAIRNKAIKLLIITQTSFFALILLLFFVINKNGFYLFFAQVNVMVLLFYYLIRKRFNLPEILFLLLVFNAFAVGVVFNAALNQKNIENAKRTCKELFSPRDVYAEFLLDETIQEIQNDPFRKRTLSSQFLSNKDFQNRVRIKHMDRYLDKFNIVDFRFLKSQRNKIDSNFVLLKADLSDFDEDKNRITNRIKQPIREAGQLGYLLNIPINFEDYHVDTLYIKLLQNKLIFENPLPFSLETNVLDFDFSTQNFSSAIYINQKLINRQGEFPYRLKANFLPFKTGFKIQKDKGFSHILYRPDAKNLVVVSMPKTSLFQIITTASSLFLLAVFIALLFLFFINISKTKRIINKISYQNRIEFVLISSIVFLMVLIALITTRYTIYNNKKEQIKNLTEKAQNIAIYAESAIQNQDSLIKTEENISLELKQLSKKYFTEILLYDTLGNLSFSSQDNLLKRNLLAKRIHPTAFQEIALDQKTNFIQTENLGKLTYLSAYIPIQNQANQIQAILNIPSFSTEQKFKSYVSSFLGNLLNIYVLILILIVVLAFWLSEKITQPLRDMIRIIKATKMGKKPNIKLLDKQDEITLMVNEYKLMLDQLESNAEKLAQSEKDAAWRQMARQVAHEIKNPLTPIKLSVQHLKRAWKDQSHQFDNMLERVTNTILDQIDSLNRISTEFSAFAQMPVGQKEIIDLTVVASHAVRLYKDSFRVILIDETYQDESFIYADREQISRVFNNLIKNASQSKRDEEDLEIVVHLTKKPNNEFQVEIKDNGDGISEKIQEKIFVPNFTTKSSGMGLGLAIVKKMVEHNEGRIHFETKINEGTSFFIYFPEKIKL